MGIDEQLALQLAKDRMEEAIRTADRMRAIHGGQPRRSVRERLGSALVRLGHWIRG